MANRRKPSPTMASIDWVLFRAEAMERWPTAADAWRRVGGRQADISSFWGGFAAALNAPMFLGLCRALELDPYRYLILNEPEAS